MRSNFNEETYEEEGVIVTLPILRCHKRKNLKNSSLPNVEYFPLIFDVHTKIS